MPTESSYSCGSARSCTITSLMTGGSILPAATFNARQMDLWRVPSSAGSAKRLTEMLLSGAGQRNLLLRRATGIFLKTRHNQSVSGMSCDIEEIRSFWETGIPIDNDCERFRLGLLSRLQHENAATVRRNILRILVRNQWRR